MTRRVRLDQSQDYSRERRQSFTPSLAPSVTPSLAPSTNYVSHPPGHATAYPASRQPMNPYPQPMAADSRTTYQPGPYPTERTRSSSTHSSVVGGRPMDRTSQPDLIRSNGQYTSQTLPNRPGGGLTQAQTYRLQESEYAAAIPSPSSIYEERFESPRAMTPGTTWSSPTQPLNLRPRPESGASRGTSGPYDDDTSISTRDEMSPPPDYSTTDPALLMRKRTLPMNSTVGGPPRLPEVLTDIKNMSLFDGESSNRNSGQSGDWSFLANYADAGSPVAGGGANGSSSRFESSSERHSGLATIPGSRNVSGTSTVRDLRAEVGRTPVVDGDASRPRFRRDESYGFSSPVSAVESTLGGSRKSYEDELRGKLQSVVYQTIIPSGLAFTCSDFIDRVHPVVRHDPYARHRRQASDTSIVSVSTVHSGYGTGPRNSQT